LLPVALVRVLPGWTQDDSYRIRCSSRTERGVRAYSPAWSELLPGTECLAWNEINAAITAE
ncbi:hypothetical protein CQA67_30780, partial [Klebsiella pneumoniae]